MKSVTIELNRFGDPDGVLRESDTYLRAVGSEPLVEAPPGLRQKDFRLLMKKLSYDRFRGADSLEEVREKAEAALDQLVKPISELLPVPDGAGDQLRQVDVVTNALELAQLPFEILEESSSDLVLTRRVRQSWPRPPVVVNAAPRVLFVWAEPKSTKDSIKRQKVPKDEHRELLQDVLEDWLEASKPENTLVEVGNATFAQLEEKLSDPKHGFTHVHILAHGRYDDDEERVFLLLEDEEGVASAHSTDDLAAIYADAELPRPGTVVLATCHSGEVDPLEAGGTLGQVLHEAGVPVVLASQLALTQTGSNELIETFLARLVVGEDPRRALRACRDRLRERRDETYYDRVALVGFVHLDERFDETLSDFKLAIALNRLEAASKAAAKAATPADTQKRFERVRAKLRELHESGNVHGKQLEELLGLQASSLKREAERAWNAALQAPPEKREEYVELSRRALRDARVAYRKAGALSRDHHWTIVQSLVLDAVVDGTLEERHWDWIAAVQAARDAAERAPRPLDRLWGLGSLSELHIVGPLAGEADVMTDAELAKLRELATTVEGDWPLQVVVRQLDRYLGWWGKDEAWKLNNDILARAQSIRDRLLAKE